MLFITVISFVCLYFLWVFNEYTEFKEDAATITENFVASEKERLKTHVQAVMEYVHYMRGQTEKRIRNSIKGRVEEAHAIAVNIYNENKDSKSGDEIKKMITDALRPIRFNRNRGYYFAFTMEGIETLFADRPEMEGKNMLPVQGARGEFVVRDMIRLIRTTGEGFYSYTWSKPGDKNSEHLKIAYVKLFEPYGWGIGTGEYAADVEGQIQEEVLERISTIRFETEGYFFGSIFGGDPLFTNGKITKGTENVWNMTDPNGVKIIQEQNRAAKEPGGGFVSYSWQKMDSEMLSPKMSYVVGIPEWEWIIGAGVYLDTMDESIRSKKKDLYHAFLRQAVIYFAVMIFISLLIILWVSHQFLRIQSGIRLFSDFFETASLQAATINPADLQFEEFRRIAMAANRMIDVRTKVVQALRESEEKYKFLVENTCDIIWIFDLATMTYSFGSASLERVLGYTPDEATGLPLTDIFLPESRKAVQEEFRKVIREGVSDRVLMEAEHIAKDGRRVWMEINAMVQRDEGGHIVAFTGVSRDISDRKRAETEREKLQAQLLQAQKMESVGRLAGGVAHDFNNMLGVILGHTEMALERTENNGGIYSDLKEIQQAAQRSADLTRQLLTFARRQVIEPRILNLNKTVKRMISMLQRLIGEDIDLVWKPGAFLWMVKMDPSQLDQILANLCVNARDAIAGVGKVTIETGMKTFDHEYCEAHPGFVPGDFVLLEVSDDGCGMDKETLKNLFEPFFTTKETGKGTGLGLAIIYGIIKQNNGFINVYSEPGQGSSFKIYLPRCLSAEETSSVSTAGAPTPGGTETILLVEDEPAILRMTRMMLERKGYVVLSAGTPAEAIRVAEKYEGKIQLLMTDVVMPGMNGRDLSLHLRSLYPDLKHLFMSGYTANIIAHQGILDEGVAFIQKPFSMKDLAEKVREVLDTKE